VRFATQTPLCDGTTYRRRFRCISLRRPLSLQRPPGQLSIGSAESHSHADAKRHHRRDRSTRPQRRSRTDHVDAVCAPGAEDQPDDCGTASWSHHCSNVKMRFQSFFMLTTTLVAGRIAERGVGRDRGNRSPANTSSARPTACRPDRRSRSVQRAAEVRAALSRRCLHKLHNRALRCAVLPRRQWIGLRDRLCHDEHERRDDR